MNPSAYPPFKILLVDDEPSFLRSMSLTLERYGLNNIITCSEPHQVQQIMSEHSIGLVLLDLTMPVISGQELLAWFKAFCSLFF